MLSLRKNSQYNPLLILALILVCSLFLRFYSLYTPNSQIFDEVYFPVFANNYLTNTDFFDVHPPLGKLIIAGSISLLGNSPLGWRTLNAIAGVLLIAAIAGFTYDLTKRWRPTLLAALLVAIDPMALVESRVGLINIYLALFSILTLWLFWRWWNKEKETASLALACIALGAASAVKWIGIGTAGAIVVFILWTIWQKQNKKLNWRSLLLLLLAPVTYLLTFIPDLIRGQDILWWHQSAWHYHQTLAATHPYGSKWWTWPFTIRPVWLYFQALVDGRISGIVELGNIVTWIGGLIAIVSLIGKKLKPSYVFLLITYAVLFLPWAAISRVAFIYHYFVPALILLILLALVLDESVFNHPKWRWLGISFLTVSAAFFVYFLPLLTGWPISGAFYAHHLWFQSWI